jgi:uncharacterized protein YbjQ (UPF0145 family)
MRSIAAAVLVVCSAACATTPPAQIVANPRNLALQQPAQVAQIPLLTGGAPKGCTYRIVGQLSPALPTALQNAAYERQANAVINVHPQSRAITSVNEPSASNHASTAVLLAGTAVRFDDQACVPAAQHG